MTARDASCSKASLSILALFPWRKAGKRQIPAIAAHIRTAAFLGPALIALAACHSYHVDTTIENRTGSDIQLLEVDYPSASFGADRIASGADYHYRFQIRGSGPLKITYTGADNRQIQINGPTLVERQEGQLQIVLLSGGKARFLPRLTPPS